MFVYTFSVCLSNVRESTALPAMWFQYSQTKFIFHHLLHDVTEILPSWYRSINVEAKVIPWFECIHEHFQNPRCTKLVTA
jgi:hypothetical protein